MLEVASEVVRSLAKRWAGCDEGVASGRGALAVRSPSGKLESSAHTSHGYSVTKSDQWGQ